MEAGGFEWPQHELQLRPVLPRRHPLGSFRIECPYAVWPVLFQAGESIRASSVLDRTLLIASVELSFKGILSQLV